ncbi:ethanolamine utilization protein EutQ [Falsigemmobacter intermedius]|uniref:Ethanolamine utilization protein EutQ n=1 Tax=Falsigemmobacter intermedius TaxID=1553448 RepID=A0A444MC00_9RHOB|nr:ethanolamine utilization protein EutQ [Falsigemmobacter intermedius]RWY41535.1 ethanolamine utilization protein EutQ [Falsigemmobacter intermedius]
MTSTEKTPPRVARFADLSFAPRFAYPEMCEVTEVAGLADRSELAGGFARFRAAEIPWQVRYDELILVLEGQFSVETPEGVLSAGPRDTIWLPAGTPVTYRAEDALVFYSLQPASWASAEGEA